MTLVCASGRMPGQVHHGVCLPNEQVEIFIISFSHVSNNSKVHAHVFQVYF